MSTTVALLLAAAGVGLGHAILPDHWVPLAVIGRTRRYPLARIARLSLTAGVAHVLLSVVLGALVIVIGSSLRSTVQSAQDAIVGGLLLATGIGFAVLELTGRGHHHGPGGHTHSHEDHDHDGHDHDLDDEPRGRLGRLASVAVPFGAAASPDLTILPVFLAASATGVGVAIGSVLLFAVATIGAIVALTLIAAAGGYQLRGAWLERWGNALTAAVLVVIGGLVLAGVI